MSPGSADSLESQDRAEEEHDERGGAEAEGDTARDSQVEIVSEHVTDAAAEECPEYFRRPLRLSANRDGEARDKDDGTDALGGVGVNPAGTEQEVLVTAGDGCSRGVAADDRDQVCDQELAQKKEAVKSER